MIFYSYTIAMSRFDHPGLIKKGEKRNPKGMQHVNALGAQKMSKRLDRLDMETYLKLKDMSKDQLLTIIKNIGGAMWSIGIKTDDEIAEAMRLKMAIQGLTEPKIAKSLPAMREWFDRTQGKATQRVDVTQKIGIMAMVMESAKNNKDLLLEHAQGANGNAQIALDASQAATDAIIENVIADEE